MIINTNYSSVLRGAMGALQSNPQVAKVSRPVIARSNGHDANVEGGHDRIHSLLNETSRRVISHIDGSNPYTKADIPTLRQTLNEIRLINDSDMPPHFLTYKQNLLRDIPEIISALNAQNN